MLDGYQIAGVILISILFIESAIVMVIAVRKFYFELKEKYLDLTRMYQYFTIIIVLAFSMAFYIIMIIPDITDLTIEIFRTFALMVYAYIIGNQLTTITMAIHIRAINLYDENDFNSSQMIKYIRRREKILIGVFVLLLFLMVTIKTVFIMRSYDICNFESFFDSIHDEVHLSGKFLFVFHQILYILFKFFPGILAVPDVLAYYLLSSIMKKSLYYYYTKCSRHFKILLIINNFYLLGIVIFAIILLTTKKKFYSIVRITSHINGDENSMNKLIYGVMAVILYNLMLVYAYFNSKNIKLKEYLFDLLRSIKQEHIYDKGSLFVFQSKGFRKREILAARFYNSVNSEEDLHDQLKIDEYNDSNDSNTFTYMEEYKSLRLKSTVKSFK